MGAFLLHGCELFLKTSLSVRLNDMNIQTAKSILAISCRDVVRLPEKAKSASARYAATADSTNGKTKENRLIILNFIRAFKRIKDRIKLYPSIMIITSA